jgi:hypothetical protein
LIVLFYLTTFSLFGVMCSSKKNCEHKWEACGRKLSEAFAWRYWKALQKHVKVFCLLD